MAHQNDNENRLILKRKPFKSLMTELFVFMAHANWALKYYNSCEIAGEHNCSSKQSSLKNDTEISIIIHSLCAIISVIRTTLHNTRLLGYLRLPPTRNMFANIFTSCVMMC